VRYHSFLHSQDALYHEILEEKRGSHTHESHSPLPSPLPLASSFVPETLLKARKRRDDLRAAALASRKDEKVAGKKRRGDELKRAEDYLKGAFGDREERAPSALRRHLAGAPAPPLPAHPTRPLFLTRTPRPAPSPPPPPPPRPAQSTRPRSAR
jgi:hypothetical protein